MGPNETLYTKESLDPMIAAVSPRALETHDRSRRWQIITLIAGVAGLAYLFSADLDDSTYWWTYSGILAGMIGGGQYSKYLHRRSVREYNEDLKSRFTPTVGAHWEF